MSFSSILIFSETNPIVKCFLLEQLALFSWPYKSVPNLEHLPEATPPHLWIIAWSDWVQTSSELRHSLQNHYPNDRILLEIPPHLSFEAIKNTLESTRPYDFIMSPLDPLKLELSLYLAAQHHHPAHSSNRSTSEVIQAFCHDVNNPLLVISLIAQNLSVQSQVELTSQASLVQSSERLNRSVEKIKQCLQQLSQLR